MTNSDGSYNTSSNPAAPGSYVTFYLTGEGQTDSTRFGRQCRNFHGKRSPPGHGSDCGAHSATSLRRISARKRQRIRPNQCRHPCRYAVRRQPPLVVQIGGVSSQTGVTLAVSGPPAPIPGCATEPYGISEFQCSDRADMDASGLTCDTVPYRTPDCRIRLHRKLP